VLVEFAAAAHVHDPGLLVDVVPRQAGGFARAQTEVEHRDPHRFERCVPCRREELRGLSSGHALAADCGAGDGRDLDNGRDVASDMTATLSPGERESECGAELVA